MLKSLVVLENMCNFAAHNIKIRMKKYLLIITLLALFSGNIFADNLSVGTVQMIAGSTKEISISMNNSKQYAAFQFDLVLPQGVGVASGNVDGLAVSLTSRKADHVLHAAKVSANTYRLLGYSLTNAAFSGTEGALVQVTLSAAPSVPVGSLTANLVSTVFVEANDTQTEPDGTSFAIQVGDMVDFTFKAAGKSGDYYYATSHNDDNACWYPADHFKVYSATVDGSYVIMKEAAVQDGYYKVKKGEPCILQSAEQQATYVLKDASFDNISTMPAENDMKIAAEDFTPSRLKYQYKLGNKNGVVAFWRVTSGTIKKNNIYIQAAEVADRLDLVLDGEATAVSSEETMASAQEETFSAGGFEYKVIADGAAEITGVTTAVSGTLTVPAKLDNYTVAAIGNEAFKGAAITELDLTAATGLQRIGESAFANCSKLTTVKFPALEKSSLTEVGTLAFHHDTALRSMNLQDTRIEVLESLFTKDMNDEVYFDDLTELVLPETLKEIKGYAMQFLGIKEMIIPKTVEAIGDGILEGNIYLETFIWKGARVTSLPRHTFLGDDALRTVYFLTNHDIEPDGLSDMHFYMCHKELLNVYVPHISYYVLATAGYHNFNSIYSTLVEVTDWEPDPDPTAIAAPKMKADMPSDGSVYTLQGVRVAQPRKGELYIKDGKKFVKK